MALTPTSHQFATDCPRTSVFLRSNAKFIANRAAGFSIVKVDNPHGYRTRVHGLSKAPDIHHCKSLASADLVGIPTGHWEPDLLRQHYPM